MGSSFALRCSSKRGMDRSRPHVYGIFGLAKSSPVSAFSTIFPPYMTWMRCVIPATTPRSWVMRMKAVRNSRARFFSRSRICAWMVTSRAVVGSSARISFGLHESAIAIITRWRMPPENWCG